MGPKKHFFDMNQVGRKLRKIAINPVEFEICPEIVDFTEFKRILED